jgi:hypothetical protein
MADSLYLPDFTDGWSPVDNHDQPVIICDPVTRSFRALVAPYNVCIIDGSSDCWTAPTSPSGYQWSYVDGSAAWIGWAQNHANHQLGAEEARDVYANTSAAVSRVKYYDLPERGGIYAFGELHPSVDETACALLNTMALSGDWRSVNRRYDFAGSQVVLVPAFRRNPKGSRRLSVRKYSGDCVIASMSWEKPMTETECSCKHPESKTASIAFTVDMLAPKTAAAGTTLLSKEYPIAVLNAATGDGRALTGVLFDEIPVSLNIDHDSAIRSIVGTVSGVRLDGDIVYGTISIDSAFEFSTLAVAALESGVAGFSVELDDAKVEWMPAAMAAMRGINVGSMSPDDEVMVQSGRLRGVGVVQTPAFIETEAARVASASAETPVVEVTAPVEDAQEEEPAQAEAPQAPTTETEIETELETELAALLIATAGEFPNLEVAQ